MAIGAYIERLDERRDAVLAALAAALGTRVVTNSLQSIESQSAADLAQGVVMLVSVRERSYSRGLGMAATKGLQEFLLVGHLRVAADAPPSAIEDAEMALIEELKAFVRGGVSGMSVRLGEVRQSQQLDHPYGWVVAHLDVGPPESSVA